MSKDHWDAILASAPLNATAGAVTSQSSYEGTEKEVQERSWDGPPALLALPKWVSAQPGFVDLTGRTIGRLKVLGMLAQKASESERGLWVCRCACGRYVGRKAKALKLGTTDRCDECNYTAHLTWAASTEQARKRAESDEARKW